MTSFVAQGTRREETALRRALTGGTRNDPDEGCGVDTVAIIVLFLL